MSIFNNTFYPIASGKTDIGTATMPFNNIYAQTINIIGAIITPQLSGFTSIGLATKAFLTGYFTTLQTVNLTPQNSGIGTIGSPSQAYSTGYFDNIISPVTTKVWCSFNGTGGVGTNQAIYGSYNTNKVIKNSNGDFTLFFNTTILTGYCFTGAGAQDNNNYSVQPLSSVSLSGSSVRFLCTDPNGVLYNKAYVSVMIVGL